MLDEKLLRFLGFELRIYDEVVCDSREGMTDEFQGKVRNLMSDMMIVFNTLKEAE